ncbi:hypothetical protein ABE82_26480 (plasmid) [Paenibacillus peoriae]|uniref:hypothetical protein n=1 Tax=Paenibacillus peoriae TaxID=59893 RepID=UPI000720EAC0|nr:hypothetical protein [Paenibacillus peoriae]ALS09962.1 hypothetical protein ABE82_26480 [Paenibacillus peoriae]
MNKQDILKTSKKLKKERLIIGELRNEENMREVLTVMSTGHRIKSLDHRKLLIDVISRNPDK